MATLESVELDELDTILVAYINNTTLFPIVNSDGQEKIKERMLGWSIFLRRIDQPDFYFKLAEQFDYAYQKMKVEG